jgi:hypothetical protein
MKTLTTMLQYIFLVWASLHTESWNTAYEACAPSDIAEDINEQPLKLHLHFQKQFRETENTLKIRKYIFFLKKTGPVMDNYF